MLVRGLLIEGVNLRCLSVSADGNNVRSDHFDGSQVSPGEKEPGPLTRKSARYSSTNRPPGAVNHCNLVFEQHDVLFVLNPFVDCYYGHGRCEDTRRISLPTVSSF